MDFENKKQQKLEAANNSVRNQKDVDFIYGVNETVNPGLFGNIESMLIESQKVSLKEKAIFFHLFYVLIGAGITTLQSLKVLSSKTTNQKFKRVLNTMAHDIEKGESLSRAMEKFSNVFTKTEIGVIKSGEAIGAIDRMLKRLAEQTEQENELITNLKGSLTYPAIVFGILIIASGIMFGFVIPKLVILFQDNNIELPLITKILLFMSTIVTEYWGIMAVVVLALVFALKAYSESDEGKFEMDLIKLKLPVFGEIFRKVYVAQFFNAFGLLMDAGVPLQETLSIIADGLDNEAYKLKSEEIKIKVQQGEKVSANLLTAPFLFPETTARMIEIGEKSATLSEMGLKISSQYMNEVQYTLKNLTNVLGPIVIVIVGVFVGVFAMAILSPIFKLSEGIV